MVGLHDQCGYVSSLCSSHIDDVLGNVCTQLLWVFVMKTYPQQHHDFGRLNHTPGGEDEMPMLIKADLPLFAETAMAIAQVEFVMQVATYDWHRYLIFSLCIAATRIQDLDPLKYLAQIIVVCTCVTDHSTTQRSRNADAKLESTPAHRCEFMHQERPADASISQQECSAIPLIIDTIGAEGDMCHNALDTGIGIQHIGAIASDEQRVVSFRTQSHQVNQLFS